MIDAETKHPIENVSVYISNSSNGTRTDSMGHFKLTLPSNEQVELVLSTMGYTTKAIPLSTSDKLDDLKIYLQAKAADLPDVVLRTYIKDGWKIWGKTFLEQFIGTYPLNDECKLLNPEAIHFQFKKMDSILIAFADETLIIENKKIGYLLHYDLTDFKVDFLNNRTYFQGYPLFEEVNSSRRIIKNRSDIYKGSLMHFMRSIFLNKLAENHFEVRKAIKTIQKGGKDIVIDGNTNYDVNDIVKLEAIGPYLVGDSIAYGASDHTAGMFFDHFLQVTFTDKQVPYYFSKVRSMPGSGNQNITSEITLTKKKPLYIYQNGSFQESNNLLITGYWSWAEKLGYLLPFDYVPTK